MLGAVVPRAAAAPVAQALDDEAQACMVCSCHAKLDRLPVLNHTETKIFSNSVSVELDVFYLLINTLAG